ncbi:uroporphyrinogen-III synthase [Sphingosinicella terrae]|uniref:uroporphyrinogen-III synthase n=1 Tax=Sphingosinicella terrae TaxID=2172047 RepID=UPI0025496F23|nr:uroporphyrinogen-III synthase [Sphingosinicella terrae]
MLRPQPAAEVTAERARKLGLAPIVAPLFQIEPLPWDPPPPSLYDAVMVTSASAIRCAGDGLTSFLPLPCYAVGEASAAAAQRAGFADVRTGTLDGAALVAMMAADGVGRAFHPAGEDRSRLPDTGVRIDPVVVYAARAERCLPVEAARAIEEGALVLLHSPRAAVHFAGLVGLERGRIGLAAISAAAAKAAGSGWRSIDIAPRPRDEALLELAAKLCQTDRDDR